MSNVASAGGEAVPDVSPAAHGTIGGPADGGGPPEHGDAQHLAQAGHYRVLRVALGVIRLGPVLILAGLVVAMTLLSPVFLGAFPGRVLNVHPSLLPAFPGTDGQRQAWEHGVKVSGATVHVVDEGLDAGPIVAQEAVPVLEDDGPEDLAARVLEAEHRIYPRAVRLWLSGRWTIEGRRFVVKPA